MKNSIFLIALIFSSLAFGRDTYVKGYVKKDGTYVQPHFRSAPNDTKFDNYSTKGNINPYTGKEGTVDPYSYSGSFRSWDNERNDSNDED